MVFRLEEVSQHTLSQAENLSVFLSQVLPFASLYGVQMCVQLQIR